MSIKQKITEDLKAAMKAGDTLRRDTLRMLDSMIKNTEIEKLKKDKGLDDQEVQAVIARAIKQRKDAAEQYDAGGRPELAEKEQNEIKILSVYLPAQLSEEDVKAIVREVITQTGAATKADIGKVMGQAMGRIKAQADGNVVKRIVEELLA